MTGNGRAFSAGFDLKSAAGLAAKKDTDISRYGCEGKRDSQGIPGGKGFCGLSERAGACRVAGLSLVGRLPLSQFLVSAQSSTCMHTQALLRLATPPPPYCSLSPLALPPSVLPCSPALTFPPTPTAALKPIIAAVNGIAHGGGFETAISCDVIFASEEKADFALPEPKVGLFAAAGGVIKLPRMIGYHNAMAMILTGKRVGAAEGRRLGFVQEVVKHDKLLPAALDFARQTLLCSPDSIEASIQVAKAASRNMLGGFTSENEAQMLQRHLPAVKRMNQSPNRFEGPRAFSEKRTPNWEPPAPLEDFEDGGEAAGQDGDGKARAKL